MKKMRCNTIEVRDLVVRDDQHIERLTVSGPREVDGDDYRTLLKIKDKVLLDLWCGITIEYDVNEESCNISKLHFHGRSLWNPLLRSENLFPDEILDFPSLEVLRIENLDFKQLPESIGKLKSLKELAFINNMGFRDLPKQIGELTNLEKLDLFGWRALYSLPIEMKNLVNLRELRVNPECDNASKIIPVIPNLQVLRLEESEMTKVPSWVCNLTNLKALYLNRNWYLRQLPDEMVNMQSLEVLDTRGTAVAKSTQWLDFKKLKNLRVWRVFSFHDLLSQLVITPNAAFMRQLEELVKEHPSLICLGKGISWHSMRGLGRELLRKRAKRNPVRRYCYCDRNGSNKKIIKEDLSTLPLGFWPYILKRAWVTVPDECGGCCDKHDCLFFNRDDAVFLLLVTFSGFLKF